LPEKGIETMNRSLQLGLISFSIALTSASAASACNVGTAVTRANFMKLSQCVNNLENQVTTLQTTIAQMNSAQGIVTTKATEPDVPLDPNASWSGMAGTYSLVDPAAHATCPPGSWISGIQAFKISGGFAGLSGPVQPMSTMRFICRGLH
jgi:hypothetical protein